MYQCLLSNDISTYALDSCRFGSFAWQVRSDFYGSVYISTRRGLGRFFGELCRADVSSIFLNYPLLVAWSFIDLWSSFLSCVSLMMCSQSTKRQSFVVVYSYLHDSAYFYFMGIFRIYTHPG